MATSPSDVPVPIRHLFTGGRASFHFKKTGKWRAVFSLYREAMVGLQGVESVNFKTKRILPKGESVQRFVMTIVASTVIVLTMTTGCFSPSFSECAVQCGDQGSCPSGTSCLADGVCHASASDSLCSAPFEDSGNATPDALVDANAVPFDAFIGCGDGVIAPTLFEVCDDFNVNDEDGCDSLCQVEAGFFCFGVPSVCRRAPGPGQLVITEIMNDPCANDGAGCRVTDNNGEWIEVQNVSSEPLQLQDMEIRDFGNQVTSISIPLTILPGQFMVFGNNSDPLDNGGIQIDFAYPTADFVLANGSDEVQLVNPLTGEEIDVVRYSTSVFPNTRGTSKSLDPDFTNSVTNDLGDNWCDGSIVFGIGDFGTPGLANPQCP